MPVNITRKIDNRICDQVPVAPLQRATDAPPVFNQLWMNESYGPLDLPIERGIPTLITWNFGGKDVMVEGSWDNWASRYSYFHNNIETKF